MNMKKLLPRTNTIESLEARIAPATLVTYPKPIDAEWIPLALGTPVQLFAGQGLSTLGEKKGSYLLFVEKGSAIVFTQDYDGDDTFDANEITGIAAGDGLRLISFVDIHGDIVTNLKETTIVEDRSGVLVNRVILTLSDSDNNPSNDTQGLKGDGRVLLNNTIEKVELRPLTLADIPDQNDDGAVNDFDLDLRQPPRSTFSVYGSIYAGRGFGADDGGLIFNPTGVDATGGTAAPAVQNYVPMVDSIRIGTAVSGQYYTFGVSGEYRVGNLLIGDNLSGNIVPFIPAVGAAGGSINTVKTLDDSPFNIGFLVAGNGGAGGAGGNISNVTMTSDDTNGYQLIAGNGGTGRTGGDGGSIINFSDTGSFTGLVILSGGDGGIGTIGSGGNAGSSVFTTLNLKGNVHVDMGDAGRGFTNGGSGASLASGIFTEPATPLTKTLNGWGTTHLPDTSNGAYSARLGVTAAIDFNGDGEGDFIYATSDASQLVVMISDPLPDTDPNDLGWLKFKNRDGLDNQGIYLSGPRNAKALSVGDVNGDGHPDIVAASRDFGGTGDLVVFLAKFEDLNNDGIVSSDEDLNGNGVDDFIGFYEGRHSTIPIFGSNSFGSNDLAIGDFDGDGRPEIVVAAHINAVFMTADLELNPVTGEMEYTGQFYYDYGRKTVKVDGQTFQAELKVSAFPVTPATIGANGSAVSTPYRPVVLEATTINAIGDTYDVIVASAWGCDAAVTLDYSDRTPNPLLPPSPLPVGVYNLGVVDLNRGTPVQLQPFRLYDLTTVDFDGDGDMDVAAISLDQGNHQGFMNGSEGNGVGSGTSASDQGGSQAGNYFELPPGSRSLYTIRAGDVDGDGLDDLVMSHEIGALLVRWAPGPDAAALLDIISPGGVASGGDQGENETNHSFADPVYLSVNDPIPASVFGVGWSDSGTVVFGSLIISPLLYVPEVPDVPYLEYSLNISAGNGGSALVGKGGAGGFLGGTSTLTNLVDPTTGLPVLDPFTGIPIVQLTGAIQINPSITVQMQAGVGGDGFTNGGVGGSITGVSIYNGGALILDHRLAAGDGGRGVFGTGGAGGSLVSNSLFAAVELVAGDGGVGKIGGAGGSIVGSNASYDIYNSSVAVIAGQGGLGSLSGGKGGGIVDFVARIPDPRNPGEPVTSLPPIPALLDHYLYYRAGDGGSAVTGKGGDGGSITNSSPTIGIQLMGELIVYAGDGGIGNSGGNGGNISDFSVFPDGTSNDYLPKFVTLLAGNGGKAFTGKGGNGGNLANINASGLSSETFSTSDIQSVYQVYQPASRFHFNRLIAGAAGSSGGNDGGTGGSVSNVIAFTPLGSFAVVGGAGGDGFRKGGLGGSALNIRIDFGASSISKALIAAGAGGDAASFIINPIDTTVNQGPNAFGGRIGKGGNGGSVIGVVQKGALDSHMDLIAGDGGSTIHYGTILDKKGAVGVGGSIREVNIVSSLGNMSPAVALKSYNDVLNGESFAQFVQIDLIDEAQPIGVPVGTKALLDDGLGNVGIVVGAAGRNKSFILDPVNNPTIYKSSPSKVGINGSLVNVFARNLMSALAGSVDRVAAIQVYQSVTITNETGSNKNPRLISLSGGPGTIVQDFAGANGLPTTSHEPVLEGINVDGAIISHKFLNGRGAKIAPPRNGYIR